MFHGVGINVEARMRFEEKTLRERLDAVLNDQRLIGSIILDRTNIKETEVSELFLTAQTKDTAYAISSGIIHEVRNVQIPAGGPIISLVFQRQGGQGIGF